MFNLLNFMWLSLTFIVTIFGINVIFLRGVIPKFITQAYIFGKTSKLIKGKTFVTYFEVPKRWFVHFYIFASLYFFVFLCEVCRRYFTGTATEAINVLLDVTTSRERKSAISSESALVLTFLWVLHAFRRWYECLYVSVYSDSKMNISHYLLGLLFYFGVGLSLISEAPGFESNAEGYLQQNFSILNWISPSHLIGVAIFLYASFVHHRSHVDLAALRKDDKGEKVVTLTHVMPSGGWFDLVSCPHFFAEIVIYMSANLMMDGLSSTWWLVSLWTVANQTILGIIAHQWYKQTFKNYPLSRKAIIPWVL